MYTLSYLIYIVYICSFLLPLIFYKNKGTLSSAGKFTCKLFKLSIKDIHICIMDYYLHLRVAIYSNQYMIVLLRSDTI